MQASFDFNKKDLLEIMFCYTVFGFVRKETEGDGGKDKSELFGRVLFVVKVCHWLQG